MEIDQLRLDCAAKQKRGLHFILASVVIWLAVLCVHLSSLPILSKNMLTFFCTAPLMPLSFGISKLIKVDFQSKGNPLMSLGILLSVGQIPYLLLAMWIFNANPDKMAMVLAVIFGAHLMPFSWLYKSRVYLILSIVIPICAMFVGLSFKPYILAATMVGLEVVFCLALMAENKQLKPAV